MTLIEIMVAMSIFTIVAFGTISGMLQSRRMTEGSIYQNTAATIAQGYIEQMMNMEFTLLDAPVITQLFSQGTDDSLTPSPLPSDPEVGNAATDVENVRRIDINNTPTDTGDDLTIRFVLYIEDLSDLAAGIGESRKIILRYRYTNPGASGSETTNTLFNIRSRVATF